MSLINFYTDVRNQTENICKPLNTEDYIPQPITDVSPPKWHLGHTTWFFETFVLKKYLKEYKVFDEKMDFIFNSYYENVGKRVAREKRGFLTRPTVQDIYSYRTYVDTHMTKLLSGNITRELNDLVILGCNHEQQHQELLWTDIKYILGAQPLMPEYTSKDPHKTASTGPGKWIRIPQGIYPIGFSEQGFCFDNELDTHEVNLDEFSIMDKPVTNGEYTEFIEDGGYKNVNLWHSEGWAWVNKSQDSLPLYWEERSDEYYNYTLRGLAPVEPDQPVCHVNFYEASAYAAWAGARLPTEFEWETASNLIQWGDRWEWTNSAYLPYPRYKKAEGAIGEYNGKFMVSQMVLRGASVATPKGHSRKSYRNFWHPWYQFQFSGIRLAK